MKTKRRVGRSRGLDQGFAVRRCAFGVWPRCLQPDAEPSIPVRRRGSGSVRRRLPVGDGPGGHPRQGPPRIAAADAHPRASTAVEPRPTDLEVAGAGLGFRPEHQALGLNYGARRPGSPGARPEPKPQSSECTPRPVSHAAARTGAGDVRPCAVAHRGGTPSRRRPGTSPCQLGDPCTRPSRHAICEGHSTPTASPLQPGASWRRAPRGMGQDGLIDVRWNENGQVHGFCNELMSISALPISLGRPFQRGERSRSQNAVESSEGGS